MSYVLTPLSLNQLKGFFNKDSIEVINYFLKKSIISQPEKLKGQDDIPIQIPKEHIEQWVVQALGAIPTGAGSYPIDVRTSTWGADVKMLSCKINNREELTSADSGETSLAQKFGDDNFGDGNTLDKLFADKKYQFIWDKWQDILINKYKKVETDFDINSIYYFIILRAGSDFHLCGLKVDLTEIKKTKVNKVRSTDDSIWIKNFIDDDFGHVKIYKAKKRFELRLKPKKWVDSKSVITFSTDFEQRTVNILELTKTNGLEDYIKKEIIPILSGKKA